MSIFRPALVAAAAVASVFVAACSASTADPSGGDTGDEQDVSSLQHCGGIAGLQCASGKTCIDDPTDSCDPNAGGADCGGVCVNLATAKKCGGFAGLTCSSSSTCVDDPTDSCDPSKGGADCMGVCVKGKAPATQSCANVRCSAGTHCEMKGINGGAIPVCIQDSGPSDCRTLTCASGMHCEMKGINGGSIPVCIKN
jgi:hypothetical protein